MHPRTVEVFVHWLYYQRLPNKDDHADLCTAWHYDIDNGHPDAEFNLKVNNLSHLYVFCDGYEVQQLKRQSLDKIISHISVHPSMPPRGCVEIAFDHLPAKDPFCRFLVDAFTYWSMDDYWSQELISFFPSPFLLDVLLKYAQNKVRDDTHHKEPLVCNYHDHKTEEERKACPSTLVKKK